MDVLNTENTELSNELCDLNGLCRINKYQDNYHARYSLIEITISLLGTFPTLLVFIDHSSPIFFAFRVFHKYGI